MVLDPLDAETSQARSPDRTLPGQEFVETDAVADTRFIDAYQAAVHRRQHLGLSARNPTLEPRRRESIGGQDFAIWAERHSGSPALILCAHGTFAATSAGSPRLA